MNRPTRFTAVFVFLVAAVVARAGTAAFEWQTATPEKYGIPAAKLEDFRAELARHGTTAMLVSIDDHIVLEWYGPGASAKKWHYSASMAKALVGGMSVAVALSDGRLSLDDPAAKFVPEWRTDPVKARITLRELGSHTSGLDDAEAHDTLHAKLAGWQGAFWKRLPPPRDPFTLSRDVVPLRFTPGTRMFYSNPGIAMLAYATTAALQDAPQKDLRTLLRERVMRPIGVPDDEWDVGYQQTMKVDGLPLVAAWGGGAYTARAAARIGRLVLREGDWQGTQVIKPEAVRAVVRDAGTPGDGAIGWWSNNDGTISTMPRDAYWGAGAEHQVTLVIPSLQLILVRNGGDLDPNLGFDPALRQDLFDPFMAAIAAYRNRKAE